MIYLKKNKSQFDNDVKTENDASRRLILKIVNSLNAKMEIGSPMASMYLLGNPDHYTSHKYVCFWWKSYVTYLQRSDKTSENDMVDIQGADLPSVENEDQVQIGQEEGVYIATTNIDDYKYRPDIYLNVSLYEWIQISHKRRANKKELENLWAPLPAKVTNTGYHQFTEGHPMRVSHVVKCNFDRLKFVVPNVVGGARPASTRFRQS